MKNIKVKLLPHERENLQKLAEFLYKNDEVLYEGEPVEFSMTDYSDSEHHLLSAECGTVGCAVGWGPHAGIAKLITENWNEYSCRCFLEYFDNKRGIDFGGKNPIWTWMFSAKWALTDNSRRGAALRILYLLEFGMPENYQDQWEGDAPLCYIDYEPNLSES